MEPTKLSDYLERQKLAVEGYKTRLRDKALAILGGRCANPNCGWVNVDGSKGCVDKRCLQIDHKKGWGCQDRKRWRSSDALYRFIINNVNRDEWFQLLCANCNWIKRAVNGESKGFIPFKVRPVHLPPIPIEDLKEDPTKPIPRPQDDPRFRPVRYWVAGQYIWRDEGSKKEPIECPFPQMVKEENNDPEWLVTYYNQILPKITVD